VRASAFPWRRRPDPSRELVGLGSGFAEIAHRAAGLVGVFEAVQEHVIDNSVMTGAIATARLRQANRAALVMLSMPPDTTISAEPALIMSVPAWWLSCQSRQTLLIGGGARRIWQPGAARGLPRRRLALSGREHAAHEDLVDPLRRQFGAFQRGADHVGTELVGAEGRKIAHEPAKRGAGGGKR